MQRSLDFLNDGKKAHAEKEKNRIERQRKTLLQNKLAFSQQKNRELKLRIQNMEQEIQKNL